MTNETPEPATAHVQPRTSAELLGNLNRSCLANVYDDADRCVLGDEHAGVCVSARDVRAYRERRLDELTTDYHHMYQATIRYGEVADALATIRYDDVRAAVAREADERARSDRAKRAALRARYGGYAEPYAYVRLFDQERGPTTYWLDASGAAVHVANMTRKHKLATLRLLLRSSRLYADRYRAQSVALAFGAPDDVIETLELQGTRAMTCPVGWLRGTNLVRELLRGVVKRRQRAVRDAYRCGRAAFCAGCRHQACGWCATCTPAAFGRFGDGRFVGSTLFGDDL